MSAKHDLFEYLKHHSNNSMELVGNIEKLGLGSILLEELTQFNSSSADKILDLRFEQRKRNGILEKELAKLASITEKQNIKLVHFKGFFLAADIYNPIETRLFDDIDLLINFEDLHRMLDILGELGYVTEKGHIPVSKDIINFKINTSDFTHIEPFAKCIDLAGEKEWIYMDLHINPLYQLNMYNSEDPRNFLNRAVCQIINDHRVLLLEIHDRLIHLMGHFSRHYELDLRKYFGNGYEYAPRVNLLHDIALLIDKYRGSIDWNGLIERTKELNQEVHVVFAVHLLNEIYPGRIDCQNIDKIYNLLNSNTVNLADIRNITIKSLIELNAEEVIFSSSYIIAKNLVDKLRANNSKLVCNYHDNISEINSDYSYSFTSIPNPKKRSDNVDLLYSDYSSDFKMNWNYKYIQAKIRLYDKRFMNKDKNNISPSKYGRIMIGFDIHEYFNQEPFIKYYFIYPNEEQNISSLLIKDHSGSAILNTELIDYKLVTYSDGYELDIMISWEFLQIKPQLSLNLGLGLGISFFDQKNSNTETALYWPNYIFHPEYATQYAQLILKE